MEINKNQNETYEQRLLNNYEKFLKLIEQLFGNELSLSVKNKNISLYKRVIKVRQSGNTTELLDGFEVLDLSGKGYFETHLQKHKSKIISGEVIIFPFYNGGNDIEKVSFLTEKTKIDRIKKWLKNTFKKIGLENI